MLGNTMSDTMPLEEKKLTLDEFVSVAKQRIDEFAAAKAEQADDTRITAHWWELWTGYMDRDDLWDA